MLDPIKRSGTETTTPSTVTVNKAVPLRVDTVRSTKSLRLGRRVSMNAGRGMARRSDEVWRFGDTWRKREKLYRMAEERRSREKRRESGGAKRVKMEEFWDILGIMYCIYSAMHKKGGDGGGDGGEAKAGGGEAVVAAEGGVEETKVAVELKKNEFYYYPPRYATEFYAYPPQMFSDENPNACSVM